MLSERWPAARVVGVNNSPEMLEQARPLAVSGRLPYLFGNPAHLVIEETQADPRWRESLQGAGLDQKSVLPLLWYVE